MPDRLAIIQHKEQAGEPLTYVEWLELEGYYHKEDEHGDNTN
jgi:hypothetical protein